MTAGNFTILVYTFLGAELIFWAVHAERFQGLYSIKKVPNCEADSCNQLNSYTKVLDTTYSGFSRI